MTLHVLYQYVWIHCSSHDSSDHVTFEFTQLPDPHWVCTLGEIHCVHRIVLAVNTSSDNKYGLVLYTCITYSMVQYVMYVYAM